MQIPGLSSNDIPYLFTKRSGLQTVGMPHDKESQPHRGFGRGEESPKRKQCREDKKRAERPARKQREERRGEDSRETEEEWIADESRGEKRRAGSREIARHDMAHASVSLPTIRIFVQADISA